MNYVNVRRTFLFIERSVRDSVIGLFSNLTTMKHVPTSKNSIAAFLFRCYNLGMLDGDTWSDSFTVQCDKENNPEADIRSGLLTVDVQIRPVFPAELYEFVSNKHQCKLDNQLMFLYIMYR